MVIVKISGGIGNQLFQYFFGKYLSKKIGTEVYYEIQTTKYCNNFTSRSFELASLGLNFNEISNANINKFRFFTSGVCEKLERKLIQFFPFLSNNYFVEYSIHKRINKKHEKNNCYYDGYWQSFSYLDLSNIEIQGLFSKFTINSSENKLLESNILKNNSVSIHIRRGDYLSIKANSKIFNICEKEYYERAIKYIKARFLISQFYIFSDDNIWAANNFTGDMYTIVSGNQPLEDLYLMSLCKCNIIANSTFSWWGAWLNNNPHKIVIYPKNWYKNKLNNHNISNLIPNQWIQI